MDAPHPAAGLIDPNWTLEDLEPATWRAIGRFFLPPQYVASAQPGEHGLFILHDGGQRPRVVDTQTGVRHDLGIRQVADPRALANALYARGAWQRVHVIDRRHLQHVARAAQAEPRRELSVDAYYRLVYQLLWDGTDGYVSVPPHPGAAYGLRYADVQAFLQRLPSPAALGLCIPGELGVILRVEAGRVRRVTTLEGLPPLPPPTLTRAFLDALCAAIRRTVAEPAWVVVCTREDFQAWLAAANKPAALRRALNRGTTLCARSP